MGNEGAHGGAMAFGGPLDKGIVDEGLEHAHEGVLVVPEYAERQLAHRPVDALVLGQTQRVRHVRRQTERHLYEPPTRLVHTTPHHNHRGTPSHAPFRASRK
jgi:hypothetical protein